MIALAAGPSLALASTSQSQAKLAATVAQGVNDRGETYFNCAAAPSVQALCPAVVAQLDTHPLNLDIPSSARWIFEGPSWQREIYLVFVVANGGCSGTNSPDRQELYHHTSSAALLPTGEKESSSTPCVLPNGAVIAYLDGQSVPDWVGSQSWTHGFFMQPHNDEYWQEHELAGRENRAPTYDAFADADGRDMCVPMDYEKVAWPDAKVSFDEYVQCSHSKAFWPAFKEIVRLHDAPLTQVIPWAVPAPKRNETELWHKLDHRSPYFTRERAISVDCRARRVLSADQHSAQPGFLSSDTSIAEENMADPEKPSEALDHQCVTVCEGDGDSSSCYPGSIVWMAHDLRAQADTSEQWKSLMRNSRKKAQEETRREARQEARKQRRLRHKR